MKNNINIENFSKCYICGSNIKKQGNSLHVWDIEYECGLKIWGAIDTKTHSNNIQIKKNCPNQH
jgi:hypothetical protein